MVNHATKSVTSRYTVATVPLFQTVPDGAHGVSYAHPYLLLPIHM